MPFFNKSSKSMDENLLLELVTHFFSTIVINEQKYVTNITSQLWNKYDDIVQSYKKYKIDIEKQCETTTIYDPYVYYYKYHTNKWVANKKYFNKVVSDLEKIET